MNGEIVRLWRRKADSDLKTGKDELASENPATDMVCFHMQQCAEKYLKAFLISRGEEITKTHNIVLLRNSASAWTLLSKHLKPPI